MSCDKEEATIENQAGTVHINSGGACTVYVQLNSGLKIEPVNRDIMEDYLIEGKQVTVSYQPKKDFVSACDKTEAVIISKIR